MTAPLDEKAIAQAHEAYAKTTGGLLDGNPMANAIRAYLSAVALPDELEGGLAIDLRSASRKVKALKEYTTLAGAAKTTLHRLAETSERGADAISQAHSTIAALRAEIEGLRKERDVMVDISRDLRRKHPLAWKFDMIDAANTRAETAEAEVKRLTEEKEALGGGLSEERREVAAGQAWDFVKPGLVAMNQDKGPAGVWSAGFRSGWDAAARAALSGSEKE